MQEIISDLKLKTRFDVIENNTLASCFAVSNLASASIGAVGSALAELIVELELASSTPRVIVNQRLAALWFAQSIYPIDWKLPPVWDSIAGDYKTKDGWIKLHTNLPHHRTAALSVLNCEANRETITKIIADWSANELETEIVNANGVAAMMRSREQWQNHSQGFG